ncbi:MAG: hypothetical protein IT371_15115 [Deltaproteobacteria bacterium]|nr:hypothetical protein [Deltaproteobacteria bacterium]
MPHLQQIAVAVVLGSLSGCTDLRAFEGEWRGAVVAEEAVRQGFAQGTTVAPLALSSVDLHALSATLTTSDGKFHDTRLARVTKAASDVLATLSFDGQPIRSYLAFAPLANDPTGPWTLALISLFADERVELRLIRGNDLFGVFRLRRE